MQHTSNQQIQKPSIIKSKILLGLAGISLIALFCSENNSVSSLTQNFPVSISGKITDDSGDVLAGAALTLEKSKLSCVTEANGTFAVSGVASMESSFSDVIAVSKDGYIRCRISIHYPVEKDMVIRMLPCAGTVEDVDGNTYQTVRIGNQIWTVENLRVTRYNDGSPLPYVSDGNAWEELTTPAYCYYNNETHQDSIQKLGALYTWYTVSPDNPRSIAPAGWRVPSKTDWETLINYLVSNTASNAVAKLVASQSDWFFDEIVEHNVEAVGHNVTGNNKTGLSLTPYGYRGCEGSFNYLTIGSGWWSSTQEQPSCAYSLRLRYFDGNYPPIDASMKKCGSAVRLVKE